MTNNLTSQMTMLLQFGLLTLVYISIGNAAAYGGTPTAASSCWIPGCPPLTSGRTTAPARRWAEVMMLC